MVNVRPEILSAVVQIIDMSAAKGVFVGNDLSTVGTVRQELVDLIKSASLQEKVPAAETVEPVEPSDK
jgi:hypothetical protein